MSSLPPSKARPPPFNSFADNPQPTHAQHADVEETRNPIMERISDFGRFSKMYRESLVLTCSDWKDVSLKHVHRIISDLRSVPMDILEVSGIPEWEPPYPPRSSLEPEAFVQVKPKKHTTCTGDHHPECPVIPSFLPSFLDGTGTFGLYLRHTILRGSMCTKAPKGLLTCFKRRS